MQGARPPPVPAVNPVVESVVVVVVVVVAVNAASVVVVVMVIVIVIVMALPREACPICEPGLEKVCNSSNRASSAFSGRC